MAADAVVIGGGPGAVRAAAALRRAGRRVVLLQEGAHAGGLAHRDVPVGLGAGVAPAGTHAHLGPLVEVERADRAVLLGGKARRLPLGKHEVAALFPAGDVGGAAVAWARTRMTAELRQLIGGGRELRSYRDWIVQHFGEPAYRGVYAAYCGKRFGPPAEVTGNVARVFHGLPRGGALVAPAGGPAPVLREQLEGVEVRTGVDVRAVGPGWVDTGDGRVEGDVHVDAAPARVVAWLGSALGGEVAHDVARLRLRHALQVLVRGGDALPYETHVLDAQAPFYRLVRFGQLPGCPALRGTVSAQYALEADDPLWTASDAEAVARTVEALRRAGVTDADGSDARVVRIPDHHPVWVETHLVRMRRYVLALEDVGVVPVGRAGLFAPLGWGEEAAWLDALGSELPMRERMRRCVEPPVPAPVEPAHITRFVER